jgi:hypothetical protein
MFGRLVNHIDLDLLPGLEAMLAGTYADHLERRGHPVPAWAWTNLLAHGSEEALRLAMRSRRRSFWDVNVWRRARAYLAGEVLDTATRTGSLSSVQAAVLVPLELELLSRVPARSPQAGQWATRVLTALEEHSRVVRRTA